MTEKKEISIIFPDGSKRCYLKPITGLKIAQDIRPSFAKEALLVRVNGVLWDLSREIVQESHVEILTRTHPDVLEILRHDAAHVMAEAVKELYPETQVTIGPAIENGFYYDFYRETSFTPSDLEKIENRMREIVDRDEEVTREVWGRSQALEYFQSLGETFKVEIIQSLPANEDITLYRQGAFVDLCRGPHLPSTGCLGHAFKVMKVAGAYWRGDSKNPMMQRIYGTAWATSQHLKDYLHLLEEAEKRDHRRLAREMDLFHLQEEAPGSVFWHPKGWNLYLALQKYMRERQRQFGYHEVQTPLLLDRSLWEQSGHWEKFRENMFTTSEVEDKVFAIKPMNCPCHVQVFRQGMKSYRDLPYRMAEFGSCHRNEPSGALHGLMRVRAFTQDDAHIFCTPDQIIDETRRFCEMLKRVYQDLEFKDLRVRYADRPEKRAGSDEIWTKAEDSLRAATEKAGLTYTLNPGEGAFYGPKLEFVLKDTIGREWQCGTLQADFILPERLNATYVGEDGKKHHPVMLHRAIFGSFERFIGILIEHYAGRFPLWLAPIQVVVASLTNDFDAYAQEVAQNLQNKGMRVEVDLRYEKINLKIRELSLQKIPVILVVGAKELETRTVTVRRLGKKEQESLPLDRALENLVKEGRSPADLR